MHLKILRFKIYIENYKKKVNERKKKERKGVEVQLKTIER